MHIRVHFGALKGKIGLLHGAVDQLQVFAVAEGLGTDDAAVFQPQILAVPSQILALDGAVAHHHIAAVPEGVLGVQHGVFNGQVVHVLEGILALEMPVPDGHIPAAHEYILALQMAAGHGYIRAVPAELRGLDAAVLQRDVAAFPQGFHAAQLAIPNDAVLCVPQGSAGGFGALAVGHGKMGGMPQGIAQQETAVFHIHAAALLQGRFSVRLAGKSAVFYHCIGYMVERALLIHGLIDDHLLHWFLSIGSVTVRCVLLVFILFPALRLSFGRRYPAGTAILHHTSKPAGWQAKK